MATSISARLVGNQLLGNADTTEVHDLTKEQQCQIATIVQNGQAVTFSPDTLAQARSEGYDNCHHCIGGSTR
ncbi:MAG TPA: hypothetical protein QGG37_00725 [Chloroflexota bacterium]|nr:hypothetical protein [Chloroflexota bacterium]